MIRFAAATCMTLALATHASALDLDKMSPSEKEAFGSAVRSYLLENPQVLVEVISVLEEQQAAAQDMSEAQMISALSNEIFEDGFSYVGGNPDGDITLVEFIDYRCGYCRKAHPEVTELLRTDGNIRFIIKEFPILGEDSTLASRFALSVKLVAGEAAYFDMHNALLDGASAMSEGRLRRMANSAGLDADAIMEGMDDPEIDRILQANYQLAQAMQITGTPSFVLGETMLRGYAPLNVMEQMVAEQRQ